MASPKISLRGVTKAFGAKQVLRGIDLDVAPAESVVVIGGSGTGKSVLLKCILGLMRPDSRLDQGRRRRKPSACATTAGPRSCASSACCSRAARCSTRCASGRTWPSGRSRATAWIPAKAREVAIAKLGNVGLGPEIGELYPSELSGGMQKRVALARAIAREPEIIFFDEPTTGLDPIMADVINELIVKCVSDLGATAVSITHDMASARKIGHRIAMLYDGKLIWQGPVGEIDRTNNAHVDQFIHGRAEGPIQMQVRKF